MGPPPTITQIAEAFSHRFRVITADDTVVVDERRSVVEPPQAGHLGVWIPSAVRDEVPASTSEQSCVNRSRRQVDPRDQGSRHEFGGNGSNNPEGANLTAVGGPKRGPASREGRA